jgi:hypothetical protein
LLNAFRKIRVKDKDLEQVQSNISNTIAPVLKSLIVDGVLVKDIVLASGVNRVNHTLGRPPEGWIIVDRNSAATVFKTVPVAGTANTITDSSTISLTASGAVTVSIWFF